MEKDVLDIVARVAKVRRRRRERHTVRLNLINVCLRPGTTAGGNKNEPIPPRTPQAGVSGTTGMRTSRKYPADPEARRERYYKDAHEEKMTRAPGLPA